MNLLKIATQRAAVALSLLSVVLLVGCATKPPYWSSKLEPVGKGDTTVDELIRVGDRIAVNYPDHPDGPKNTDEVIGNDGFLTVLLNKRIKVVGKTRQQAQTEIHQAFVPAVYKRLTVLVRTDDRFFTASGEVRQPSRSIYTSDLTVLRALAAVGGFTEFSDKRHVELTRGDRRKFRVDAIKAQEDPTLDPPVYPGDVIYVPRRLY